MQCFIALRLSGRCLLQTSTERICGYPCTLPYATAVRTSSANPGRRASGPGNFPGHGLALRAAAPAGLAARKPRRRAAHGRTRPGGAQPARAWCAPLFMDEVQLLMERLLRQVPGRYGRAAGAGAAPLQAPRTSSRPSPASPTSWPCTWPGPCAPALCPPPRPWPISGATSPTSPSKPPATSWRRQCCGGN